VLLTGSTFTTPVIKRLRTRACAHIIAAVAVKNCCNSTGAAHIAERSITDHMSIIRSARRAEIDLLRERSFPLNLLSSRSNEILEGPQHEV
jgi:hypothetical protein